MILIQDLNLKELAESKGVMQMDVVKRTNISRSTIGRYWSDRKCHYIDGHGIKSDNLYKVLDALDMRLVIMDRTEYERLKRNENI